MSSSLGSPESPVGPVQLSGWKDIGAYLGRSVRTVQRWEKEFGLPVRRLGTSKPESVFAFPREIDAWLQSALGASARAGAPPPGSAGGPAERRTPKPLFDAMELARLGVTGVVTAIVTTVLWALWTFWLPGRGPAVAAGPADWHVDLDSLVVSDARGRALWRHEFPHELIASLYEGSRLTPRPLLGGVVDLDDDGRREVWFVARSAGGPAGTSLYLFEHNGRVRWVHQPTMSVRFGADTFGPSWIVDRGFVTPDPSGGTGRALWAVLYDSALFPSAIQRLDPKTGSPLSAYWTNGSIVTAAFDGSASPPKLLVGACYNETRAGSLSVLDARSANGSAPADLEKYRCASCPPGAPLAFFVFPKPARFSGQDGAGPVETITPMAGGALGVRVRYAQPDPQTAAVGVFAFDASLVPISADTADGYLRAYDTLVARGEVPAGAPATVDPDREFFPLLKWDGSARRFVEVFRHR